MNQNPYGQPPPQSPYGMPGAPMQAYGGGGPPPVRAGIIEERNSAMVCVLSFVTCGFYALYWMYKTSSELKEATGDTQINPGLDLVVSLLTCGLWGMFVQYRNTEKVQKTIVQFEPQHKDQSQTVLILGIASFVTGFTWLVSVYLVQEELNALARAASRGGGQAFSR